MDNSSTKLVLASASLARQQMLSASGLNVEIQPSSIDEAAERDTLTADGQFVEPSEVARRLAIAKAEQVSADNPSAVVIGGDQVLAFGGNCLTKPDDLEAARRQLCVLRGKTHALHAAVALAMNGAACWSHVSSAELKMRDFSDQFLSDYLQQEGETVCQSVGAYRIEGLGIQLFERVTGDYFTILGLPLVPLLCELRRHRHIGV